MLYPFKTFARLSFRIFFQNLLKLTLALFPVVVFFFFVWEPKRAQRQRFASSIALIGSSVGTESSVLVLPNMDCRVLRVAGHSSNQCSSAWLSWRHFGHLGSVVGFIRRRYAASCMLCPALSLANMTASQSR